MVKAQKVYLPWLTKKKSTTGYERQVLASAVPNMGILSGDSQADMRSFYYSSSSTSTLTREEDDNMTGVDDNINAINSIELFSTTMTTAAVSVPAVIVPMTTILTESQPKGTTQMASASMQRNIEECIVQSDTEYMRRVIEELQQKNKKSSLHNWGEKRGAWYSSWNWNTYS